MKNVYILTNFSAYLKSYSPIIVVGEQIKMLKRNGYEPTLVVSEGWSPPEGVFDDVRTIYAPNVPVSNDPVEDATFQDDVDNLVKFFANHFPEEGVVLTHDLIYLPDYVKHNIAARRVAINRPKLRWLHLLHSATNPRQLIKERSMYSEQYKRLLEEKFPNSFIMFPNRGDIPRVAVNFGFEEDEVFCVPHSTDPTEGMDPLVKKLYDEAKLGEADVIMVYPLRLDRGKNAEKNIRVIAQCKKIGLNSRLIFCDFQSTGGDKVEYRADLKKLAEAQGLELGKDLVFISEFDENSEMEVSHQVVLDLFVLSNVALIPSKSETYSLVAQEAMLKGNLCILNHDFTPMRSIYGHHAIYRQFSANIGFDGMNGEITTDYGNEDEYMNRIAMNIKYYLNNDKVLSGKTFVRRDRNPDAVFKKFLEPLICYEQDV